MKKLLTFTTLTSIYLAVLPYLFLAKANCGLALPGGFQVTGPVSCKFATFGGVISAFFTPILGIAGFITVIIIIISGIQFVTSGGNPEAAASARGRLTFAIIGFVIISLAFAILQIVNRIFLGTTIA